MWCRGLLSRISTTGGMRQYLQTTIEDMVAKAEARVAALTAEQGTNQARQRHDRGGEERGKRRAGKKAAAVAAAAAAAAAGPKPRAAASSSIRKRRLGVA